MASRLDLEILPQPDDSTCGPTCLHAVYGYYGDRLPLHEVVEEVQQLEAGGTLAVMLGVHALRRGYEASLVTYNLQVFDPTWFGVGAPDLAERLRAQAEAKDEPKLRLATEVYLEFLRLGGKVLFEDLTAALVRRFLNRDRPILTGLSATYLYRSAREREEGRRLVPDDVRGRAQGHFVVLCGYDKEKRTVLVADPLLPNPVSPTHLYEVDVDRLVNAIMLGILTYDANLLVVQPARRRSRGGDPDRRRQS